MFDVGANLGVYSFVFSANASSSRVVAFEPDAINSSIFEKTNRLCHCGNVCLERKAVSDAVGFAEFLIDDMSGATGTLVLERPSFVERHYKDTVQKLSVETTTIDEASTQFFAPDFVKIDVEGAGLHVLRGASQILSVKRPIFLIECGGDQENTDVAELLAKYNYDFKLTTPPNYLAWPSEIEI